MTLRTKIEEGITYKCRACGKTHKVSNYDLYLAKLQDGDQTATLINSLEDTNEKK